MEQIKKSKLNEGELLRFSICENGISLNSSGERSVENPIVAIGVSLGVYVATSDDHDFRSSFADLIRSFKNGYDQATKEKDDFTLEHYESKKDEKKFNKEDYK